MGNAQHVVHHSHAGLGFFIIFVFICLVAALVGLLGLALGWWGRKKYQEEMEDEDRYYGRDDRQYGSGQVLPSVQPRYEQPQHAARTYATTQSVAPVQPQRPVAPVAHAPVYGQAQRTYVEPQPVAPVQPVYAAPRQQYTQGYAPVQPAYVPVQQPVVAQRGDDGFLTSMAVAELTDSPMLGALAGGNFAGAMVGAAMADHESHHHHHGGYDGGYDGDRTIIEREVVREVPVEVPVYENRGYAPAPSCDREDSQSYQAPITRNDDGPGILDGIGSSVVDAADTVGTSVFDAAQSVGNSVSSLFGGEEDE